MPKADLSSLCDRDIFLEDLAALRTFTGELASAISIEMRRNQRFLLLLDGPMGSGKTQLTKVLVEAMTAQAAMGSLDRARPVAVSPTFAIHNTYVISPELEIEHLDLFRIDSEDDLESTGFWDLFLKTRALVVVEWAEKLSTLGLASHLPRTWPSLRVILTFDPTAPDKRNLRCSLL